MDAGAVDRDLEPVDDADDALAGQIAELRHGGQRADLDPGGVGDRAGDRMLAGVLDRAGEPEHLSSRGTVQRLDADERHPPLGDGAGLVEHDRGRAARLLEHLGPLDQDAELRTAAGADEQRRRRREPERARARDDQDGDGRRERERRIGARAEPEAERGDGDRDHDRDEDGRDAVGEPLHGRLARLRLGDESPDLGDGGVGSDMGGADDEPAGDVDRRADRLVAGADLDGNALTGQQRRVHRRRAGLDHAVGGDLLAWADDEEIADAELLDGDAPLLAVRADDGDVLRTELEQRLQRCAGAALGPRLEVPARQDQHDHDRRDLEVDLAGTRADAEGELEVHPHRQIARGAEEERVQRPAPGGERADRDQRVHRRRAVARVHERGAVERPAAPEDDRRRQLQREPLPAVELERRDHREREHGQRQHSGDEQPEAERRGRILLLRDGLVGRKRSLVAGRLDRRDELLRRDGAGVELHRRALGRVVDGGA